MPRATELQFFTMKGCGHCEAIKDVIARFIQSARELGIKVLHLVQGTPEKNQYVEQDQTAGQIRGFPTIRVKVNGEYLEYNGERSYDAIFAFINNPVLSGGGLKELFKSWFYKLDESSVNPTQSTNETQNIKSEAKIVGASTPSTPNLMDKAWESVASAKQLIGQAGGGLVSELYAGIDGQNGGGLVSELYAGIDQTGGGIVSELYAGIDGQNGGGIVSELYAGIDQAGGGIVSELYAGIDQVGGGIVSELYAGIDQVGGGIVSELYAGIDQVGGGIVSELYAGIDQAGGGIVSELYADIDQTGGCGCGSKSPFLEDEPAPGSCNGGGLVSELYAGLSETHTSPRPGVDYAAKAAMYQRLLKNSR